MSVIDRYAYWQNACLAVAMGLPIPGNIDDPAAPFDGFYRFRYSKLHPWLPIAIYLVDGKQVAMLGVGDDARMVDPLTYWMGCALNPVTEAQYRHARQFGTWHDTLYAAKSDAEPGVPVVDVSRAKAIGPTRA